jgi:hypothetical protein
MRCNVVIWQAYNHLTCFPHPSYYFYAHRLNSLVLWFMEALSCDLLKHFPVLFIFISFSLCCLHLWVFVSETLYCVAFICFHSMVIEH